MRRVFSRVSYAALALVVAVLVFFEITAAPTLPLFWQIVSDPQLPRAQASAIGTRLLLSVFTDNPAATLFYYLTLSILVGVNIALLVFFTRMYRTAPSTTPLASSIGGIVSAVLGFGCAACGSAFGAALLASIGGAGILVALPFHGLELDALAIYLLMFSLFSLVRTINKPPTCPI